MLQRVKEVQESDLRMDGALAHNIQRVLPVTQADIDAAAAQGKSWLVKRVVKVNDPLDNLRGGTQLVIKQNSIQPSQNVRRVLIVSGPGGETVVIGPGPSPLLLPDAIADSLTYVKAFGGTGQGGVPSGYTLLNGVANGSGTYIDTGITPAVDDVEIEIRVKPTTGSWYILQSRASGGTIWGISGSSSGATILLGWGGVGSLCQSSIIRDPTHTYYVKATMNNGNATLYVKDETDNTEDTKTATYTSAVPSLPFWLYGNQNSDRVNSGNTVYMARIKVGGVTVMDYVPALNPSTVVGFYDKTTGNFKVSDAGTLTADQTIVPTPTTPIDIVCNNGALKYTPNLLDMAAENIVLGKYINNSGVVTDSGPNFYNSKYIPVVAGETYTWSTSSSIGYLSVMEYDGNYVFKKRTLFSNAGTSGSLTLGSDTAFVLIGSNMDGSDVTLDKIAAVDWQFEKGSSATAYKPYSPTGIYTDGTVETIKDSLNNTATAEMLLKVGDYQDVQSILDGVITRNVGIKVLDGTEDWAFRNQSLSLFYATIADTYFNDSQANHLALSTHFLGVEVNNTNMPDNSCKCASLTGTNSLQMFVKSTNFAAPEDIKSWVAAQYAAGTPVIVIYPLAEPTTESVTGQTLQVTDGDNTLEITQASLSGLELEAEYQKVA